MDTVNRKALKAFTQFVSGYGMVHGNPDAEDAKVVMVPEVAVDQLVAEGKIGEDDVKPGKAPRAASPRQPAATPPAETDFVATYKPIGKFEITGPGLAEPEIFKGNKAGADARILELREAAIAAASGRTDDAPAD